MQFIWMKRKPSFKLDLKNYLDNSGESSLFYLLNYLGNWLCPSVPLQRTQGPHAFLASPFLSFPFMWQYSCLKQEDLWIITHQLSLVLFSPVLFANLSNSNLPGWHSPNGPWVPKRFFNHKIILSSATLKGVISLPFGYVQSNWCADRILFVERAYFRAACLDTQKFRNLNSGQNSYLFLSGNSSLTTAVFCLLALVLFHVMVEHFNSREQMGKGWDLVPGNGLSPDRAPAQAEC